MATARPWLAWGILPLVLVALWEPLLLACLELFNYLYIAPVMTLVLILAVYSATVETFGDKKLTLWMLKLVVVMVLMAIAILVIMGGDWLGIGQVMEGHSLPWRVLFIFGFLWAFWFSIYTGSCAFMDKVLFLSYVAVGFLILTMVVILEYAKNSGNQITATEMKSTSITNLVNKGKIKNPLEYSKEKVGIPVKSSILKVNLDKDDDVDSDDREENDQKSINKEKDKKKNKAPLPVEKQTKNSNDDEDKRDDDDKRENKKPVNKPNPNNDKDDDNHNQKDIKNVDEEEDESRPLPNHKDEKQKDNSNNNKGDKEEREKDKQDRNEDEDKEKQRESGNYDHKEKDD